MRPSLSRAMKLFGTEEPVPETPLLRAGPLEASSTPAICATSGCRREAIRAISYIVRDRNWGTYNPEITNLHIEQDAAGFRVTLRRGVPRRAAGSPIAPGITADAARQSRRSRPKGRRSTTSSPTAPASSSCTRSRASAARRSRSLHVDGTVEHSRFPELIDPTCPFRTSAR